MDRVPGWDGLNGGETGSDEAGAELSRTVNGLHSVEEGVANPDRKWGKDSKVRMALVETTGRAVSKEK